MMSLFTSLLVPVVCCIAQVDARTELPQRWETRIPNSFLSVAFRSSSYAVDQEGTISLRQTLRNKKVLLAGTLGEGVNMSLIATPLDPSRPTAKAIAEKQGHEGASFEVGDVACVEQAMDLGPIQQVSWYGISVCGTYWLDLHVSMLSEGGKPVGAKFDRTDFEALVKSMQYSSTRRVGSDDYTDAIRAAMDRGLRAEDPRAAFDAMLKEKPADPGILFARAEVMPEFESSKDELMRCAQEAVDVIDKTKDEAVIPFWVRMIALDNLALRMQNTNHHKESVPVLERAIAATPPDDPLAGSMNYNLACSYARLENASKAIAALKHAIAQNERFKKTAAGDTDFESLRKNAEFLALLK